MGLSKKELGDLRKAWTEAPETVGGDLPEGKYQFKVLSAEIDKAGSGRLQCVWTYKVVGGPEETVGEKVSLAEGIETPENIGWLKRKLARMGYGKYDLNDFDTISEILDGIKGLVFEGQVKHKDGFMNVYANKLVSEPGEDGGEDDDGDDKKEKGKAKEKAGKEKPEGKGPKRKAREEEEEAEGGGDDDGDEIPEGRNYPTLDRIGKMDADALQKLLDDFNLTIPKSKKKDVGFVRDVTKAIVSIMEDDDHKAEKEVLQFILEEGAEAEPKKTTSAMEQQVIDWLTELQG